MKPVKLVLKTLVNVLHIVEMEKLKMQKPVVVVQKMSVNVVEVVETVFWNLEKNVITEIKIEKMVNVMNNVLM
ncbi:hypothetical protein IKO18_05915 [bacterium]|nr:hypothetical protein [bacterium]